jgi:hypothetical protein
MQSGSRFIVLVLFLASADCGTSKTTPPAEGTGPTAPSSSVEGYPCRRILLDAADLVDIEVVPDDNNAEVGLQAGARAGFPIYRPQLDRRTTMSGPGEFWVVASEAGGQPLWVTLTATRH